MKFLARIYIPITADSPEKAEEIMLSYIRTGIKTTGFIEVELIQLKEKEEETAMDYQKLLTLLNTDKMEKN